MRSPEVIGNITISFHTAHMTSYSTLTETRVGLGCFRGCTISSNL